MAAKSFSHLMSNLFVGLSKGSPALRPYSTKFSRELGYRLFGLESKFAASQASSSVKPDMVVSSPKTSNVLVLEWTENRNALQKDAQFGKYAKMIKRDLIDVLGVPVNEAGSHDVVIVVPDVCAPDYEALIKTRKWGFPMLVHKIDASGDSLNRNGSPMSTPKTDAFFQGGINLNPERIPLHYIPVPLDGITTKSIAPNVVAELISIATKGGGEVSLERFCESYFPIWDKLDGSIQKEIRDKTKGVLTRLCRKPSMKSLITRSNQNPPKWNVANIRGSGGNKALQQRMQEFVNDVRGDPHQPDLFD